MARSEQKAKKAITLRGLPPEVARVISRKARQTGESVNRVVIGLLEESAGEKKRRKKVLYHDLDHLFGIWSREEAKLFERALRDQREIDSELWK